MYIVYVYSIQIFWQNGYHMNKYVPYLFARYIFTVYAILQIALI